MNEWNSLDGSVKSQFKKILQKRLLSPRLPGSELHRDLNNCYKIKLRQSGYRLIYEVSDSNQALLVLAVHKRDDFLAYKLAAKRR
jgi:mRNA interferase RelE/StbE